jgi:hypothetical protein
MTYDNRNDMRHSQSQWHVTVAMTCDSRNDMRHSQSQWHVTMAVAWSSCSSTLKARFAVRTQRRGQGFANLIWTASWQNFKSQLKCAKWSEEKDSPFSCRKNQFRKRRDDQRWGGSGPGLSPTFFPLFSKAQSQVQLKMDLFSKFFKFAKANSLKPEPGPSLQKPCPTQLYIDGRHFVFVFWREKWFLAFLWRSDAGWPDEFEKKSPKI